jgi:ribonuclease inhibitor
MPITKCDLTRIDSLNTFYNQISSGLKLPAHFGRNLDALEDALNDAPGPVELFWHDAIAARNDMGEDAFESLTAVLHAVASNRDDFKVWIGLS